MKRKLEDAPLKVQCDRGRCVKTCIIHPTSIMHKVYRIVSIGSVSHRIWCTAVCSKKRVVVTLFSSVSVFKVCTQQRSGAVSAAKRKEPLAVGREDGHTQTVLV